jgi:hypothetical protein
MDGVAPQSRARGFRIFVSLFVVLVASGICAGASVQWSAASSALPRSMFSSGALALVGGSVVLDGHRLAPGQTVTGSVAVVNEGDAAGRFALRSSSPVDKPGLDGGSLARTLRVSVTDVTVAGAPRLLYEGSLVGLTAVDLGTLASGAMRTLRIAVSFPRQTIDGAAFAGSSSSISFDWTAVKIG